MPRRPVATRSRPFIVGASSDRCASGATSSAVRGKGVGRALIEESFAIALNLGLEKLCAHMTVDQRGAIEIFEGLGFRGEALLRDQVKDPDGTKHDIVILSHDVARVQAQMEAYGVTSAF